MWIKAAPQVLLKFFKIFLTFLQIFILENYNITYMVKSILVATHSWFFPTNNIMVTL